MRGWLRTVLGPGLALALAACGGGGGAAPATGTADAPFAGFASFQAADLVFGQPVFAFNDPNRGGPQPSAASLACPGMPSVGPLFVPDVDNHRVLGFAQNPVLSNLDANFVLGQPDFAFAFPGVGPTAMNTPAAALVHAGRLLVSDSGNHRVLVYADVPTTKGAPAAFALGQSDLVSALPAGGRDGLNRPHGLAAAGSKLVVADRGNHRVLIWNTFPTAPGAGPDLVLGQADFDGTLLNAGASVGAHTLFDPCGVWTDGTRLVVADRGNHRVLVWQAFPTTNGQPADLVLGQPDGSSRTPGAGPHRFFQPADVDSNGVQLVVGDAGNHRVLLWYAFPEIDFQPAEGVLGQADFDHRAPNDANQDGHEDAVSSARTLKSKDGALTVRLDGRTLFVGDTGNHRLLVFQGR